MSQANSAIVSVDKEIEPTILFQQLPNNTYTITNSTGAISITYWNSSSKLKLRNIYNLNGIIKLDAMIVNIPISFIQLQHSVDKNTWTATQGLFLGGGSWNITTTTQKQMNFQFMEIPEVDAYYRLVVFLNKISPTTATGGMSINDFNIFSLGKLKL